MRILVMITLIAVLFFSVTGGKPQSKYHQWVFPVTAILIIVWIIFLFVNLSPSPEI